MASYRDDDRSRPSRRQESFTPPPEETTYPKAGHRHYRRAGSRHGRPQHAQSTQSPPRRDNYDSRYHSGRPPHSLNRKRYSWPPPPTAEDEVASLKREADSAEQLKRLSNADVPARGTINQESLIEDAPGYVNEHERRFVLLPDLERNASTAYPTPPTSDDEQKRKARRRPSKLDTKMDEGVPEMSRRTASPYAYKPATLSKEKSSFDRYLSPDVMTPLPLEQLKTYAALSGPPSPRRNSDRLSPSARKGSDYFTADDVTEEAVADDPPYDGKYAKPGKSRRESSRPLSSKTPSSAAPRESTPLSDTRPPTRKSNLDTRRHTDNASTFPTLSNLNVERTRRPSPLMASGSLSDLASSNSPAYPVSGSSTPPTDGLLGLPSRAREGSYASLASSRGVSPASGRAQRDTSPPRSQNHSYRRSHDQVAADSSVPRVSSYQDSRPPSPPAWNIGDSPRLPRTDMDWSALLAADAVRRGKTRLPSTRQEAMPEIPQLTSSIPSLTNRFSTSSSTSSYDRPSSSGNSLPYPEDDGLMSTPTAFMPSEREHQYFGPPTIGLSAPFSNKTKPAASREPSPGIPSAVRPSRPALAQRHSDMYIPQASVEEWPREKLAKPAMCEQAEPNGYEPVHTSPTSSRSGRTIGSARVELSAQVKKELASLKKKGLPNCTRPQPVSGKEVWYTIIGSPELNICPSCFDIFERTVFRPQIRRAPPRDLSEEMRCSFGSSRWVQLAWILTLEQQRTDLILLKDVSEVDESSDPCPGIGEAMRSWYGLRDTDGIFFKDFYICYSDVRKLERLFPTLAGMFVRMPQRASLDKRSCALGNTEGNRFPAYLDGLISTHEKAISSHRGVDPMPMIDLVKRKTLLQECQRDRMLVGGFWHFIPAVPTLTVCEDCFEHLVEPEIKNKSEVALRFNRTIQPVYGEGVGTSCQLYSPYMRQVFQKALRNNDLKYLAEKSKRRRDAELKLQARWREVERRAKRLSRESCGSEDENYRMGLQRELDLIAMEWKEEWE